MLKYFCQIESLEGRQLLSASVQLTDGTLLITGTNRSDSIILSLSSLDSTMLDVKLNGHGSSFAMTDVKKIQIDALGGSDQIEIREINGAVFANALIFGGDGNDTITSGSGNDIIVGGNGNDVVSGGAGDDAIYGGAGNDTLLGGSNNDTIQAGAGSDAIRGGPGDDNMDGGAGNDSIKAGTGADSVATDTAHPNEVKGPQSGDVQKYIVTSLQDIPQQLAHVAETAVPGARTVRVEQTGQNYAIYYRFGQDPAVYKAVVSIDGMGNVNLVGRDVSLSEARPAALKAFTDTTPNLGLVSLFQLPHDEFTVRYRATDGTIQSAQTQNIIWGMDDAARDLNNDGYDDGNEPNNNGQQNGNGQPGGGVAPHNHRTKAVHRA